MKINKAAFAAKMKDLVTEAIPYIDGKEITQTSKLQDLDFDSMTFVSLVIEIEEKFHVRFPDDALDFTKMQDFGELCDCVYNLLGQEGSNV